MIINLMKLSFSTTVYRCYLPGFEPWNCQIKKSQTIRVDVDVQCMCNSSKHLINGNALVAPLVKHFQLFPFLKACWSLTHCHFKSFLSVKGCLKHFITILSFLMKKINLKIILFFQQGVMLDTFFWFVSTLPANRWCFQEGNLLLIYGSFSSSAMICTDLWVSRTGLYRLKY